MSGLAVKPKTLEKSLAEIASIIPFVDLAEGVELFHRKQPLTQSVAVLTFDEGFAASVEHALPICRKLQIPFTVFVSTAHLSGRTHLWDDKVHAFLSAMAPKPFSVPWYDRILKTSTPAERLKSGTALISHFAELEEKQLKKKFKDLQIKHGARQKMHSVDRLLTAEEITRLSSDPLITFAPHGHHHLPFTSLSPTRLREEMSRPRKLLKEIAGKAYVDVLSYPFGHPKFLNSKIIEMAVSTGYKAAFAAHSGIARPGEHLFRLPRLLLTEKTTGIDAFEWQGMHDTIDELLLVLTGSEAARSELVG